MIPSRPVLDLPLQEAHEVVVRRAEPLLPFDVEWS